MINYQKDDFDGSLEDIMESINSLLVKTGKGLETEEDKEESEMLRKRKLNNKKEE